jgi:hypothetical protein
MPGDPDSPGLAFVRGRGGVVGLAPESRLKRLSATYMRVAFIEECEVIIQDADKFHDMKSPILNASKPLPPKDIAVGCQPHQSPPRAKALHR